MFMMQALKMVQASQDPVVQVGCIVVSGDGSVIGRAVNGIPKQLHTAAPQPDLPFYAWVEHAERRVIYDVLCRGHSLAGSTLYLTWFPCVDCARALVQVGIATLVTSPPDFRDAVWGENLRWANTLLRVAGVTMRQVEVSL